MKKENKNIKFPTLLDKEKINAAIDFIPLGEERDINQETLPILPLRDNVLFPMVVIPISVGREKSLKLIEAVNKNNKIIGVVAQRDRNTTNPTIDDLYHIGTAAKVLKTITMPDGSLTVILRGIVRFQIDEMVQEEPYFVARVTYSKDTNKKKNNNALNIMVSTLKSMAIRLVTGSADIPDEIVFALQNMNNPTLLINQVANYFDISIEEKQELLELNDINSRADVIIDILENLLDTMEVMNPINRQVKNDMNQKQREFILNQQLKKIQEELGDDGNAKDIDELLQKASKKKWSAKVREKFDKELNKLSHLNEISIEYGIQKNYLDTLVDIPWNEYSEEDFDPWKARKIVDEDHYGLDNIKERIVEYISVLKLKKNMRSPILCFVGPPGVGKTSLGKSIARSIGREYVRMSLGGLRDEAEIRGHRKTYIGAMPGRVIQNLIKAKTANPVFILDEIDKVGGMSVNGDPSAALLELLDPEQNSTFYDNFVEMEFDLSKVLFIATANSLSNVHPALRDRMEIIELSGYLMEEKREIAKRHLIPKQRKEHGVNGNQITFSDSIIDYIIDNYTRESGVRSLDKNIASAIRHRAKEIVMGEKFKRGVTQDDITKWLGKPKFLSDDALPEPLVGVVTGLAWTAVGGTILFIETSLAMGDGKFTMTGNLGDVMKESATLAFEYVKSHAQLLGIDESIISKHNIHIHVPEGATPKDGPSAGITIFTALVSALTNKKVDNKIAMTGEITLRGKVMPVGGIKEKILAAKRAHINTIVLSKHNRTDIEEIKQEYIEGMEFIYIEDMPEIMNIAFEK